MNCLIANRAYKSDHPGTFGRPFLKSGNDNQLLTFWALSFFAGVNLSDSNLLAATLAVEFYLGRLIRYNSNAFALRAFHLPAGELVLDTDYLTT
jgi:hypothetical protein